MICLPSKLTMMIIWTTANYYNIIELHFKHSNKCVYKHKLRIISRHFTEGNMHCVFRHQAGNMFHLYESCRKQSLPQYTKKKQIKLCT